ncbi:MAG TPA: DUF2207 domain-containing protein, partial [Gemmatimonadota bacterium]|nr:DUF2207 domain-containing protein [Gemmatimonadota bacterium]
MNVRNRPSPRTGLLGGALLLLLAPGPALAQGGFRVTDFHATYEVRGDGSVAVVERVDVDFGYLWRHGIYRDLHLAGRVQRIDLGPVTDGGGRPLPVQVDRRRRTRVRIGDPDTMVTGVQSYVLRYAIHGALDHHEDRTELYWQVTGTESEVPIERAQASLALPVTAATAAGPWRAGCFAGPPDSSDETRCSADMPAPGRFRFATTDLAPGEGLTMLAVFPVGVVPRPSFLDRLRAALITFGPLGLPVVVLAGLSLMWIRSGRDPAAGSVVPQWRIPEGLGPGPAGALVDERVDTRDVVATLIDLARRGYVRIRRQDAPGPFSRLDRYEPAARALEDLGFKGWELELLTPERQGLEIYERLLLDGIFGDQRSRRLSELRNKFHVYLPEIRRAIYRQLVTRRFVRESPQGVRRRWAWGGFAVLLAGATAVVLGRDILGVGVAGSGILIMLFSKIMPATTPKGAALRRDLRGLEEYIRRAEKAEIEFREAPARTPERFSEVLPYAIALGVTEEWTRQFAGHLTSSPDWLAAGVDGLTGLEGFDLADLFSGLEGGISKALESRPEVPL